MYTNLYILLGGYFARRLASRTDLPFTDFLGSRSSAMLQNGFISKVSIPLGMALVSYNFYSRLITDLTFFDTALKYKEVVCPEELSCPLSEGLLLSLGGAESGGEE